MGLGGGQAAKRAGTSLSLFPLFCSLSLSVCTYEQYRSLCPNNSSKCNNTRYLNTHFVEFVSKTHAIAAAPAAWHTLTGLIESCKVSEGEMDRGIPSSPCLVVDHEPKQNKKK